MFTKDQLITIMPYSKKRVDKFVDPINQTLNQFRIDVTKIRMAMFIAQIAHESGELRYVRELASGKAYEGRKDLGNTSPGDGVKYKGHGLIQITGKNNHDLCGKALNLDLITNPELLEEPLYAALSAGWFWDIYKNLNPIADSGDFIKITKRINGGTNGLADRQMYFDRAKTILGI